jgi:hypothetical protein
MGDTTTGEALICEMHACEMHAYERRAYERRAYEMAAYDRHAYEMAPVRSTSERHPYEMVHGRCTPIKCPSIGDVFNQSVQITLPFGTPKWPRSSSLLYSNNAVRDL